MIVRTNGEIGFATINPPAMNMKGRDLQNVALKLASKIIEHLSKIITDDDKWIFCGNYSKGRLS